MDEWLDIKQAVERFPALVESSLRRLCNTGEITAARQVPWGKRLKWEIHISALEALTGDSPDDYDALIEEWKKELANGYLIGTKIKPITIDGYVYGMESFWNGLGLAKSVQAVTTENVRRAIAYTEKKGTRLNIYKATRSFFKLLIKKGLRPASDFHDFQKPPTNKQPKRTFVKDEAAFEKMLTETEYKMTGRGKYLQLITKTILYTAWHTGMRNGELCSLEREKVDFKNQVLTVTGKGDKTRRIGLRDELIPIMKEYLKHRPESDLPNFFLQKSGKPMNRRFVRDRIHFAATQAGANGVTPHSFRRSFITNLLLEGVAVTKVQRIVGHDRLATTQLYDMSSDEDALDVLRGKKEKPAKQEIPVLPTVSF